MPYDPMSGFKIGQEIGKSKKSAYSTAFGSVMDEFENQSKYNQDIRKAVAVQQAKSSLIGPKERAITDYYNARTKKLEDPSSNLGVSQQIRKDKRIEDLFSQVEMNKVKKGAIDKAMVSLPNIPSGLVGKFQVGLMKQFDQNNPILEDWQNLKSVLMDATLMNIGRTKGAISDREMKEFQTAAANDDLVSVSRMGNALKRLRDSLDAQERASMASYQQIYGEDPNEFLNDNPFMKSINSTKPSDSRALYNQLRAQGIPPDEAKRQSGLI